MVSIGEKTMNVTITRKFVKKTETYHDIVMILKQTHVMFANNYLLKKLNYKENKIEEIRIPCDDCEIISIDIG